MTMNTTQGAGQRAAAQIPTGWRPHDAMTVDDLLRARAIAVVLDEPGMVRKLDRELAVIYETHHAIAAAMADARRSAADASLNSKD